MSSTSRTEEIDLSPEASARRAGLDYVSDADPGYTRKKWGRGFTYLDEDGEHIRDDELRERLEALAIPPAWTDVWISPSPEGHILATGRDDAGRKQYIYHPEWERVRNEAKFDRLIPFGAALPELRQRVRADLKEEGLPFERVMALVVRLLEETLLRIGNDEYAAQNDAYGLTTLRDRHLQIDEGGFRFEFTAKSGKTQCVEVNDPELTGIVKACREVPGYEIFEFVDEQGDRHDVKSRHVNAYVREAMGGDFTAKDFRTWGGTVRAAEVLAEYGPADDADEADARVVEMVDQVAEHLSNTRAVCRDYYIHPAIIESYREGAFSEAWQRHLGEQHPEHLRPEEGALLHFLRERRGGAN